MGMNEVRNRRLRSICNRLDETDRQLCRDAERGHGPALDAWKRGRTQAAAALEIVLLKDGEGGG